MHKFILPLIVISLITFGCGTNNGELTEQQQWIANEFEIDGPSLGIHEEHAMPSFQKVQEISDLLATSGMVSDIDSMGDVIDFPGGSSTPGSGYLPDTTSGTLYHLRFYLNQEQSAGYSCVMIIAKNGDIVTSTKLARLTDSEGVKYDLTQMELSSERTSVTEFGGRTAARLDLEDGLDAMIRLIKELKD